MDYIYRWTDRQGYMAGRNALLEGSLVLADSDTVLGLLAPCSPLGFGRLNEIKERQDKPYIILVGSLEQVWEYAQKPKSEEIMRLVGCWPAPLTLILHKRMDSSHYIPSLYPKVALRIPDHEPLRQLALECNGLFSTSANITGKPTPESVQAVDASIKAHVACIVLNQKENQTSCPSTIIDCTVDPAKIVREGSYPIERLKQIYGKSFLV